MFDYNFYELTDSDMAKAELNNEFGGIIIDKKLFSLGRKRCFKLKLVVKHGKMEKIVIRAPYGFIVKLFEMFNYKPLICYDHALENNHSLFYRYVFKEEWYNPHYPDEDCNQSNPMFDDSDELPF